MFKKIKDYINPDIASDSMSAYTMMMYHIMLIKDKYCSQTLKQIDDAIKSKSVAGFPSTVFRVDKTMSDVTDNLVETFRKRGFYCEVLNLRNDQFIYINWDNRNSL